MIEAGRQYDFTLAANGVQPLDVAGEQFYLLSATGPIRVKTEKAQADIQPGQGMVAPFNRLILQDISGSANVGSIFVGGVDFIDRRIAGAVSVIDGGKARTIANNAYAGVAAVAALAANFGQLQLWNPAASGKRVIVEQLAAWSTAASGAVLQAGVASLATLVQIGKPKLLGGANSVMELRSAQSVTAPVSPSLNALTMQAGATLVYRPVDPIVILPGNGLLILATVVNTDLGVGLDWFEESTSAAA